MVLSYLQVYIGENHAHKDASMIGFKAHEGVKARCSCNKLETKVDLLVGAHDKQVIVSLVISSLIDLTK